MIPSYYEAYCFNEDFMSMRIMPLMEKDDVALVPRSCDLDNFIEFAIDFFGLSHDQFVFYDELIEENFLSESNLSFEKSCKKGFFSKLHVYAQTPLTRFVQKELEIPECNVDSEEFGLYWSDKGALSHLKKYVAMPDYEMCSSLPEIYATYRRFKESSKVLLKPVVGTGGKGVFEIKSDVQLAHYNFEYGSVIIQEYLAPDIDEDGFPFSPSVQFNGTDILGIVSQRIKDYSFKGVKSPAHITDSLYDSLNEISCQLLNVIDPQGMGGFDFIIVDNKPFLIDSNIGRITAVHPFWEFCFKFNVAPSFLGLPLHASCSVAHLFDVLKKEKLLFSFDSNSGVVPFGWVPQALGFVGVFGKNTLQIQDLRNRLLNFFDDI